MNNHKERLLTLVEMNRAIISKPNIPMGEAVAQAQDIKTATLVRKEIAQEIFRKLKSVLLHSENCSPKLKGWRMMPEVKYKVLKAKYLK